MNDNALMVQNNRLAVMPVMDNNMAMMRRQAVIDFVKSIMIEGNHYGKIPGTDKNTLLKPGAEMLASFFGLAPIFEDVVSTEDWTGAGHGGEAFFYYRQRCNLSRDGKLIASADGSCNSWEKKYRYRSAERVCPNCDKPTIRKSKYPPRNNPNAKPGWYCYAKDGGCGAEFAENDQSIKGQELGKIPNPDVAEQVNTILKMAQKRALVAAVLIAVNASEFFTQDIEDMDFGVIEGEFVEQPPKKQQPRPNGHTNGNGNGHKLPPTNEATVKNQHNAAGVSWEELGGDDSPGTIDPDKLVFYRGKVQSNPRSTVATVCNAAAMTGAYRGDAHAINAALAMNADLERGMKLTTDEALNLFDKLMARKQQPQPLVTVDAPQVDAGYAE